MYAVEWSADSKYLAIATETGLKIYNSQLSLVKTFYENKPVYGFSWKSDNNKFAVTTETKIEVWSWDSNSLSSQFLQSIILDGVIIGVYWKPNSDYIATLSYNSDSIFSNSELALAKVGFWDSTNSQHLILAQYNYITRVSYLNSDMLAWNLSGDEIILVGNLGELVNGVIISRTSPGIFFINSNTGLVIREITLSDSSQYTLALNPLGNLLAIGGNGGVQVWNIQTNLRIRPLSYSVPDITSVTWSPDGRYLFGGGQIIDVVNQIKVAESYSFNPYFAVWNNKYELVTIELNGNTKIENLATIGNLRVPTLTPFPTHPRGRVQHDGGIRQ